MTETEYVLNEQLRVTTLLQGEKKKAKREKLLDELVRLINEQKRLLGICDDNEGGQ